MTPNKALDIIAGLLARIVPTDENTATTNEAWEAISVLRSVVEERDALKAEVEHRCDQRDAALESVGLLTAEVARLSQVHKDIIERADRAEKAEAELELSDKSWDIKQKQLEEARAEVERLNFERDFFQSGAVIRMKAAEAELEAARPLIKAALDWDGTMRNSTDLQTAALAYSEKVKGK